MSRFQSAFCRSAPWRTFARRVVLPWALQGVRPRGDVLEIGAGSGAMAAELLATYPDVDLTVTDVDNEMVEAASARLLPFGDRVTARLADATALPFPDGAFDAVLSWVMLHHTLEWENALTEAIRVLRPGGQLVGYDLLSTAPLRLLHRDAGSHLRMMRLSELRAACRDLPVDMALLTPSLAGITVRFTLQKAGGPDETGWPRPVVRRQ
jgi:ubiquinone/menaquinone biosynthesis C-methylase UbiE